MYRTVTVGGPKPAPKSDHPVVECALTHQEVWAFFGLVLAAGGLAWVVNDDPALIGAGVVALLLLVAANATKGN